MVMRPARLGICVALVLGCMVLILTHFATGYGDIPATRRAKIDFLNTASEQPLEVIGSEESELDGDDTD